MKHIHTGEPTDWTEDLSVLRDLLRRTLNPNLPLPQIRQHGHLVQLSVVQGEPLVTLQKFPLQKPVGEFLYTIAIAEGNTPPQPVTRPDMLVGSILAVVRWHLTHYVE